MVGASCHDQSLKNKEQGRLNCQTTELQVNIYLKGHHGGFSNMQD